MPPQQNQVPPVPPVAPAPMTSQQNNTIMAVLAYLGILIIVPFVTDAKNDPFVKFHLKQGLVLIISEVIGLFIGVVPILGWIISPFWMLFNVIMIILGIVNAATGKQKQLPVIGSIGNSFKF
jgi:uncharacterized membrane protein